MSYLDRFRREVPEDKALEVNKGPKIELAVVAYEPILFFKLTDMKYADDLNNWKAEGRSFDEIRSLLENHEKPWAEFVEKSEIPRVKLYDAMDYVRWMDMQDYSSINLEHAGRCISHLAGMLKADSKEGGFDGAEIIFFSGLYAGQNALDSALYLSEVHNLKVKVVNTGITNLKSLCDVEIVQGERHDICKKIDRYLELPFISSHIFASVEIKGGELR